jgi:acyl-CoA thioester hydrolase
MARVKIDLPGNFFFSCKIPVRITDLNYGGHAGNDSVLSIIHESRMQYLDSVGYTEMNFAGVGMIMTHVAIEFKSELFYGDVVIASVAAVEFSKIGFELVYKLEKENSGSVKPVAFARTGMVCYDYEMKKIVEVPGEARLKLATGNGHR